MKRRSTGEGPTWILALILSACPIGGVVFAGVGLRGCMTSHSRPAGHGDVSFDVSPDGKTLAFAGVGQGGRDLYLFDLPSQRVTPLTSSDAYEICPSFSPDGRSLVFTRGTPGVRADQLCVMTLSTRKIEQITDADENVSSPIFLPDGKRILCTVESRYRWGGLASSWNEGGELRTIDVRTRKQSRLKTSAVPVFAPEVSADGRWIAWIDDGAYVAPLASPAKASKVMSGAVSLDFSANGTKLAVSAGQYSPDHKIYLSDVRGKVRRPISGLVEGCFNPVFSPDGKSVYFLSEAWPHGATGVPVMSLMRASTATDEVVEIASSQLFEKPLAFTAVPPRP